MLRGKFDETMGWTGKRTDTYCCFDELMIKTLKLHGNTVMQTSIFKKTVRKIYKKKTGMSFKLYKTDYLTTNDEQVKDAMAFWYAYISALVGFEVTVRTLPGGTSDWSGYELEDVKCICIERKYD